MNNPFLMRFSRQKNINFEPVGISWIISMLLQKIAKARCGSG